MCTHNIYTYIHNYIYIYIREYIYIFWLYIVHTSLNQTSTIWSFTKESFRDSYDLHQRRKCKL